MTYRTYGNTYEAVCEHIGWMPQVRAIQVMPRRAAVYVTGTLLKPQEWRDLARWDGETLPDGRTIKITHAPYIL